MVRQPTTEKIVKTALTTEIKFIIVVVGFVISVATPFWLVKTDVALIKQNHYTHIENIQRELGELKKEQVRLEDRQVKLMQDISAKLDR